MDEMFVPINGKRGYLWCAFDLEDEALDILVQSRWNKKAALKPIGQAWSHEVSLASTRHTPVCGAHGPLTGRR
ncbi:MAG: DDE-type integrase/transposase/recombinase [Fimbriimonadaceae bacterium]|nr:DDE-type integrase/transposase/recombinase [Alphaproteobacteria bacterium]